MTDDPRIQQLLDEVLASDSTPEAVCASCPELLPAVRKLWRRIRRLDADLDAVFPPPGTTFLPGTGLPLVPGYEVEAELGHGGMGVVYQAWDLRLHRRVALKMLLAGRLAQSSLRERFLREAEAVASLRHPNIVQVYEAGDVDGHSYFTMELVDGGSLAQHIQGVPQPARKAAALMATLADAVRAAHQSGIVHRDLKPANILLAADGTPKVTDFGLARRRQDGDALTLSGVPLGTPSYMAPEQAQGQRDAAGPATDVYALGAILYELLTGRPPFRAATAVETLQQVISQESVPPSRLNDKVPRDLETICLKCLHKVPERRYAGAAELADDLRRFGEGRPIQARPVGRAERLWRWGRRNPTRAALLATALALMGLASAGAWLLYEQQAAARARQAQTNQKVRGVLERAHGLLAKGWTEHDLTKLTEANTEGNRAADIARSGGARVTVQQEAEAFREDAALRLGQAEKNRTLLEALLDVSAPQETKSYSRNDAGRLVMLAQPSVDDQYAAAFRRWGLDVDATPEAEVVARLRQEPDVVVQELIAGLDAWMVERRSQGRADAEWRRLFQVAEQLDRSERHQRLRAWLVGDALPQAEAVTALLQAGAHWTALWDLARGQAWQRLQMVRREINPQSEPVLTVTLLARASTKVGDAAGAEAVLRQAVTARPDQVVLLDALGRLLEQQGSSRLTEAIGYYRAARGQRHHLGIALSKALMSAGRVTEAEEVLKELARRQPDHPAPYLHLGFVLNEQKRYHEGEVACRKVIDLMPDLAEAHNNLGYALSAQGKHLEAKAAFQTAIDLKPDLAEACSNLGYTLGAQGMHSEAEASYRKAIDLKPNLAEAHNNLGYALSFQGKHREAEAAYRKAIDLAPDLAVAYSNLGSSLASQGQLGPAEVAYRKAIDLSPDLAEAYNNLGGALVRRGRPGEAEAAFRKAIDLSPDLAEPYYNLGNALMDQQKAGEAEAAYRKAIDLKPDLAEAHNNLGGALVRQQRPGEAEAAYRKAIDLRPDFGEAYANLGNALFNQAQFDAAAEALKKGDDLLAANPLSRVQLQRFQQQCERYRALDARFWAVLRGTEKLVSASDEQLDFAWLCHLKKYYAAASRLCADALAAQPRLADDPRTGFRYNAACAAALASCGRGEDGTELDDGARARWREQARQWLWADLAAWNKSLDDDTAKAGELVRRTLTHWRGDPDLAGLREPAALDKLPAEERKEWFALWEEVDALVNRTTSP
jgi:tetratricopeptide (TPR) repeat protein